MAANVAGSDTETPTYIQIHHQHSHPHIRSKPNDGALIHGSRRSLNTKEVRLDFTAKPNLTGLELLEQKLRASNLVTGQERTDETVDVLEIAERRNKPGNG